MPQITISEEVHEALSRMKQALEGLAQVYLEIDTASDKRVEGFSDDLKLDDFANALLVAALQQLRQDLLAGSDKGTMLDRFLHAARKS